MFFSCVIDLHMIIKVIFDSFCHVISTKMRNTLSSWNASCLLTKTIMNNSWKRVFIFLFLNFLRQALFYNEGSI